MSEWIRTGAWMPYASFLAIVVSTVLFAIYWGGQTASDRAVRTWQNLAEGYAETIEKLTKELADTKAEVHQLRTELAAHQDATKQAIDELIAGFKRAK